MRTGACPVLLSYGSSPTSGIALCSSVLSCGFPELVLSMHVSPFLYSVLRTPAAMVSPDSILFSQLKRRSGSAWVPPASAETWKLHAVSVISHKSSPPFVSPLLDHSPLLHDVHGLETIILYILSSFLVLSERAYPVPANSILAESKSLSLKFNLGFGFSKFRYH